MYVDYFTCDHCGWRSEEYPAEGRCPCCAVTPCGCHETMDCPDQPALGMVYQGPPGGHTFYRSPPEGVRQGANGWRWWKCLQCGTYHNADLGEELREPFNTCPPGLLGLEFFITRTSTEAVLGNRRLWGFQYESGHFVEHSHQGVKWKSTPGIRALNMDEPGVAALVERFAQGDWGNVSAEDRTSNDRSRAYLDGSAGAEASGSRIGSYLVSGTEVWVYQSRDELPTVMLPDEY